MSQACPIATTFMDGKWKNNFLRLTYVNIWRQLINCSSCSFILCGIHSDLVDYSIHVCNPHLQMPLWYQLGTLAIVTERQLHQQYCQFWLLTGEFALNLNLIRISRMSLNTTEYVWSIHTDVTEKTIFFYLGQIWFNIPWFISVTCSHFVLSYNIQCDHISKYKIKTIKYLITCTT